MNKNIRMTELCVDADGALDRQAFGFFDFSDVADVRNVRRLLVANVIKHVQNVSAAWESSVYRSVMTDTEIFPPQYFGDSIRFFWTRPFTKPESRATVEEESRAALEAAAEAVVEAGFKMMEFREFAD